MTVLLKKASGGYTERLYRILPLVGVYPSMLSTPMKLNLYVNCNNHYVIIRSCAWFEVHVYGCMQVVRYIVMQYIQC